MLWLQRSRIRHYFTNAIWIWPLFSMLAAMGAVRLLSWADAVLNPNWDFNPETSRAGLG